MASHRGGGSASWLDGSHPELRWCWDGVSSPDLRFASVGVRCILFLLFFVDSWAIGFDSYGVVGVEAWAYRSVVVSQGICNAGGCKQNTHRMVGALFISVLIFHFFDALRAAHSDGGGSVR